MYFLFCCSFSYLHFVFFFFFNDTATTEIYTLSLHDALPIYIRALLDEVPAQVEPSAVGGIADHDAALHELRRPRSEEHTSELQSLAYLVCRLLLEKKKKKKSRLPSSRTNQHQLPSADNLHFR